ncbi:PCNA-associated factor [Elysia marginata]|uniref:PCNA-associated factor n=1 Tax=Elysia marginata TaxID=1093978 RepID=A0AAV4I808_9GAST|nr:PCNA-associated factor [Elysia marginata]
MHNKTAFRCAFYPAKQPNLVQNSPLLILPARKQGLIHLHSYTFDRVLVRKPLLRHLRSEGSPVTHCVRRQSKAVLYCVVIPMSTEIAFTKRTNFQIVAGQASRKSLGGGSSSSSGDAGSPAGKGKYAGGNPVVVRPKPDWQKGIGSFFSKPSTSSSSSESSSSQESVDNESSSSTSSW